MECLRNFIGLLGCGSTEPESGLYINSLPGIPNELLHKLVNADQRTALNLWEDIQTRGLQTFSTALLNAYKRRYLIRSITASFDIGKKLSSAASTAAADELRGFTVECEYPAVEWLTGSSLRMIAVPELWLFLTTVPGAGTVTLKIFDLDTEVQLFTTAVPVADLTTGWNRVPVNKFLDAERIYCAYNATDIASRQLEINPLLLNSFSSYINSWVGNACSNCDPCKPVIRGLKSANDLTSQTFGTSTYGLSGVFSLVCKMDAFVCANRQSFATPLWYLLGAELMVTALYDKSRMNKWTLDDKTTSELHEYCLGKFETTLQQTVDGTDLNLADLCIECNEPIQQITMLP